MITLQRRKEQLSFREEILRIAADARAIDDPNWKQIFENEGIKPTRAEYKRMLDVAARTMTESYYFGREGSSTVPCLDLSDDVIPEDAE